MKKIDCEIIARLNGKVLVKNCKSFDVLVDTKGIRWFLIAFIFYLRAFLRYVSHCYGFDKNPMVGHFVVTVSCGNITTTILDMLGVISIKVSEINNLLKEKELFTKSLILLLNNSGD